MKEHWEKVYKTKQDNEVSWYQESPATSIQLVKKYAGDNKANIIDVGGGNSNFSIQLLSDRYNNLNVLDISEESLNRTQSKLKEQAKNINWFVSDILDFIPNTEYDLWHDRAVFHFLTERGDIEKYVQKLDKGLQQNGIFILATFSKKGPKKCSGLDISQYSSEELNDVFGDKFELLESFTEEHVTPFETSQDFIYTIWRKK